MNLQNLVIGCSALLTLAGPVCGGVIVVDAAGGGAFTQIQPAVDAALDGDTLLVKPGGYLEFTVDGKALTIVGDAGTIPTVAGKVSIKNLALGQTLTLARLRAQGTGFGGIGGEALTLTDCAGAVRCVGCEFTGREGTSTASASNAAVLSNASDLAFAACTAVGGAGKSGYTCLFDTVGYGQTGLYGFGDNMVAAYDCTVRGGHGGNGGDRTGPGGSGVNMAGFLLASRSDIEGGHGGDADCVYGCPNDGGDGVAVSTAWILDSTVAGGAAGELTVFSPFGRCPADPGAAYSETSPFVFGAPSLGFSIPAVAREDTHVTVTFTGPPGARVFLNDELTTTFQGVPSWRGVLLSPFPSATSPDPMRVRRWGAIPASGTLTAYYAVPHLPAGVQAQTRFLQAYRIGPNGLTLGSFRTLTVLDSAL